MAISAIQYGLKVFDCRPSFVSCRFCLRLSKVSKMLSKEALGIIAQSIYDDPFPSLKSQGVT